MIDRFRKWRQRSIDIEGIEYGIRMDMETFDAFVAVVEAAENISGPEILGLDDLEAALAHLDSLRAG